MTAGDLLADRYRIEKPLGRSASAVTYLASDTRTGAPVIAKLLSLGLVADWKSVELFEREAQVLRELHHERIPPYVDSFRADLEGEPRFVLVRGYVEGSDLQVKVEEGWRGTEAQIRDIGRQIAAVVSYIHELRPPVIHRDINPRNIVMRPDGTVALVDFGGVQDAIRLSERASTTMIGTPGYAPMEQFVGRATVRSDLYGLAATLVFLLTRRSPAALPTRNLKLDIDSVEISSAGLRRVLSNWLEPDETARTLTLAQADQLLAGGPSVDESAAASPPVPRTPPYGSRISCSLEGSSHWYSIPAGAGRPDDDGRRRSYGRRRRSGTFGIVWLGFVGFWMYSAVRMKASPTYLFFAIPFLAVGVGI
ncbi:MAG TPA: serine/threonine-protein kinase, partial [Spirochaetia bacterium]|nr:serine/threonine-protein kinase [Spirochaetia bacterium]